MSKRPRIILTSQDLDRLGIKLLNGLPAAVAFQAGSSCRRNLIDADVVEPQDVCRLMWRDHEQ